MLTRSEGPTKHSGDISAEKLMHKMKMSGISEFKEIDKVKLLKLIPVINDLAMMLFTC